MRNFALGAAIAAAMLAGCSATPPTINEYTYTSEEHSGTVSVHETLLQQTPPECLADWREGDAFVPNGLRKSAIYNLELTIMASANGTADQDISVVVPNQVGESVLMKDFQISRSFILAVDENGLVKQGEHFYYPEGFFVRASQPNIIENDLLVCLGIDRMYVPATDLNGAVDPTVRLDRIVIPFKAKAGEPQSFTFGSDEPSTLVIEAQVQ